MIRGFLQAVDALTVAQVRSRAAEHPLDRAAFFAAFPIIGVFLGLPAMFIVGMLHGYVPFFTAWIIPLLWLVLTNGAHFNGLCTTCAAFFKTGRDDEQPLTTDSPALGRPVALALAIMLGKSAALLQGQVLDSRTLGMLVLLTPVFSRYVCVLLAMAGSSFLAAEEQGVRGYRLHVIVFDTLLVLALGTIHPSFSLVLLASGLCTALAVVTLASRSKARITPQATLEALIELAEVVMLWTAIVAARWLGINLLQLYL